MTENVGSVNRQTPYHRENLRGRLLADGLALLETEGLEALSLRELARKAGVSPMAPYRHFADKAALLDALTLEGFAALREGLEAADAAAGEDARRALVAQGLVYVNFAAERPHLFGLMFGRPPSWQQGASTAELDRPGTAFHLFARRIRACAPADEFGAALLAAHACVHGLASLARDGRLRPDQASPEALERAISYVVARLTVAPSA